MSSSFLAGRMSERIESYAATRNFMGSVLVASPVGVVHHGAYGWANLEWRVANTTDTKYRLACLTRYTERGRVPAPPGVSFEPDHRSPSRPSHPSTRRPYPHARRGGRAD